VKVDLCLLFNEINILKPMLKNLKLESIIDLYIESLPLKKAFPPTTIIFLLVAAMTMSVSPTTCERIFIKMKLIKTTTLNTMSGIRWMICAF